MLTADLSRGALLAQLGSTLPLVGLIWLVQVVAYPLFARVEPASFGAYHEAHTRLITFVVAPLMLTELFAAAVWVLVPDPAVPRPVAWAGLALAVAVWGFTFFVSVPEHEALARGYDGAAIGRLVSTNWLRTVAWTARGALLLWVVGQHA